MIKRRLQRVGQDIRMSSNSERMPAENYSTPPCLCAVLTDNLRPPICRVLEPNRGGDPALAILIRERFPAGFDCRHEALLGHQAFIQSRIQGNPQ